MTFKLAVLNIVLDFSEIEVVVHESQISKLNWRLSVYSQNLYVNRWGVLFEKNNNLYCCWPLHNAIGLVKQIV